MKSYLLFLISLFIYGQLAGQTIINSDITTNTTWSEFGSPYQIQANITINSGVILIINPGVTINFEGSYWMLISGTLNAQGTIADSIIFKHNTSGQSHYGLRFEGTSAGGTLEYCTIQDGNTAGSGRSSGGGIFISQCSPTINHCTLTNNSASAGGAIGIIFASTAQITNNVFKYNSASQYGGAITCNGINTACSPVIESNIFYNNQQTSTGGTFGGGAISFYTRCTVDVLNNLFYSNTANGAGLGGGISLILSNNTINISNSIFWNNIAATDSSIYDNQSNSLTVTYSNVERGFTGTGNINSDPLFIDVSTHDFHLSENSPCIDVGTNTGNPTTDFDGNPTEQDGNDDSSDDADMGAFEFLQEVHSFSSNSSTDYQLNTFEGSPTTIASITLDGFSSGSGDITVNCFTKSNPLNAPGGSKSIKRWYRISESVGLDYGDDATLRLYYSTDEFDLSNIISESGLTLWKYETGSWVNKGGTVSTESNYVELTGVTQSELSGDWAFANASDNPLPVELISFTTNGEDEQISLHWTTASEIENLGYIIQRSNNKENGYQEIDSYAYNNDLQGAGNSSSKTEYEYIDINVNNGQKYWYKLVDVSLNGQRTEHGPIFAIPSKNELKIIDSGLPLSFDLKQNYPNPFNPSSKIGFSIPEGNNVSANVSLFIYDLLGRKIKLLYKGYISPGNYEIEWNGYNEANQPAPSGIYIYRLVTNQHYDKSKKMMLLR
jgi:hypothetical protein